MELTYEWKDRQYLAISFAGDCTGYKAAKERDAVLHQLGNASLKQIAIDTSRIEKWDTTLVVFLYEIFKTVRKKSIKVDASFPEGIESLLRLAFADDRNPELQKEVKEPFLERLGTSIIELYETFLSGWSFVREALGSIKRFIRGTAVMRKVDFFFALEECSFKALGIVSLICFMVGLIFGFVGAMQLRIFGAEVFVASLVMIVMMRVMGAVMTGVIMSGRTGSAYAATIGTMQVNEEIDALKTMGINVIDFLLLPRMAALIITMPLLTIFADVTGILGGAVVGVFVLDLPPQEYWKASVNALKLSHFLIGILHGMVFGVIIALCGCYYGIKSGKDADSVGKAATSAVVAAIVWIIVATSAITVFFQLTGV